jgi:hypothetical protein
MNGLLVSIASGLRLQALQHGVCNVFEGCAIRIHFSNQTQALESGYKEPGQRIQIGAGQFPAGLCSLECVTKRCLGGFEALSDTGQRRTIASRQLSSAIPEKAAAPAWARDDLIDELPGESAKRIANRQWLRQDGGQSGIALLDISVDRPQQQVSLASKRSVKA